MTHFLDILKNLKDVKVIDASIDYSLYTPIQLAASNKDLTPSVLKDAEAFEQYIENHLAKNKAKVAYGGYLEKRNLYKTKESIGSTLVGLGNVLINFLIKHKSFSEVDAN